MALLALIAFLAVGHNALADPRFEDVPAFWEADARIVVEVLSREGGDGPIEDARITFPAPAHPERLERLTIALDGYWVADAQPHSTHVIISDPDTVHGTWRIQPVLIGGRPVGAPLETVIPDPDARSPGFGRQNPGSGDTLLHVLNDGANDSMGGGSLWGTDPGPQASPNPGLLGTPMSGLSAGGQQGASGNTGSGSLGAPPAQARFVLDSAHTDLSGPSPPPADEVEDVVHTLLQQRATCVRSHLDTHPATLLVTVIAPPDAPVQVQVSLIPAAAGIPADAAVADAERCVQPLLQGAVWPAAGYGWRATLRGTWETP